MIRTKKIFAIAPLFCSLLITSCIQETDYYKETEPKSKDSYYDFSTTAILDLKVEYRLKGYNAGILFEVYGENPFKTEKTAEGVSDEIRRTDVKPVFKANTNAKGAFEGKMMIPAGLSSLYFVTDAIGAPACVKVPVSGTSLTVDMDTDYSAQSGDTRAIKQGINHSYPDALFPMNDKDDWDAKGIPSYLNPNGRMPVPAGLLSDLNIILAPGVDLRTTPHAYLVKPETSHSIALKEETELDMTFLSEGAGFLNTVGYYTYPTGTPPTKPADIKLIITHPNFSAVNSGGSLVPGDNVRLKYWNAATQKWEDKFPAGITVGFFLVPYGFQYNNTVGDLSDIAWMLPWKYTNPVLNNYNKPVLPPDMQQQAVALYDYKSDGRKIVVIGIEDRHRNATDCDHDFNDALFFIKSYPTSAIDVPDGRDPDMETEPQEPKPYTIEYEGYLGFEDNWPNKGDYDMNDVGMKYHTTVYYDKNNRIIKNVDVFSAVAKGATFTNGFGYQFNVSKRAISKHTISVSPSKPLYYSDFEVENELATVLLFGDIKDEVDGAWNAIQNQTSKYTYTVTVEFATPQEVSVLGFPPYNPFIFVNRTSTLSRSREVHLPNHKPTAQAMGSESQQWFGKADDRSNGSLELWYVSDENFPFAIHIPGNRFQFPNETQRIDNAYPKFIEWARTFGNVNPEWYK